MTETPRPSGNETAQAILMNNEWLWVAFLNGIPLLGMFWTHGQANTFSAFVRKSRGSKILACSPVPADGLPDGYRLWAAGDDSAELFLVTDSEGTLIDMPGYSIEDAEEVSRAWETSLASRLKR